MEEGLACGHGDIGFFFFSSRRRHTRFDCDWSSDVCSSDLHILYLRNLVPRRIVSQILFLGDNLTNAPYLGRKASSLTMSWIAAGRIARFKIGRASCRERV